MYVCIRVYTFAYEPKTAYTHPVIVISTAYVRHHFILVWCKSEAWINGEGDANVFLMTDRR